VDLTPTVAKLDDGKTVLVGGLRGGGRGIFALDISDPSKFSGADVKWEFTNEDDVDLGYTYSNITLAKMNNGEWAAIFGNGYCDEDGEVCGDGKAKLFIVSLKTGELLQEISTGAGDTGANRNGLSTPGVADLDANGTADWVYAGDLQGNLWAFDLTGKTAGEWNLAYDKALFKTADNRPITSEPMIVKHPQVYDNPLNPAEFHNTKGEPGKSNVGKASSNYPNTLVLFGTGQYLVESDKSSNEEEVFYGIWDDGTVGTPGESALEVTNLQEQISTAIGSNYRELTHNPVAYEPEEGEVKQYGWYLTLTAPKERVINRATVRNNVVFFDTVIPSDSVCDYGGAGYLMAVNLLNGGSTQRPEFNINNDDVVDETDHVVNDQGDTVPPSGRYHEGGMPVSEIMDNDIVTNDTNQPNGAPEQTRIRPARQGRLSWEELQ
jgi:type IV pilus assembly protein PilY1